MEHSKQKGNLGFSSTLKEIHKLGYNVFSEIGDNSKTDLIIEVGKRLIRIQIKYRTEKNGVVYLPIQKSGPNGYRYTYTTDDVDIFSVYLPNEDKVIFVPSKLVCKNKLGMKIRYKQAKNGQNQGVHHIQEFEDLSKIINEFLK